MANTDTGVTVFLGRQGVVLVALLGLCVGMGSIAQAADFARYSVILNRQPFAAAEPEPPPPEVVAPSDEPPAFVSKLRLVALTESPAGPQAGILDESVRPPRVYYLYEGEGQDGLTLLDTDYDREQALVSKDGEQYWMRMGASNQGGGRKDSAQRAPTRSATPAVVRAAQDNRGAAASTDSYAERRRKRLEEMRRRAEASRNLTEQEVERQLREYQMRLIREGKTPLPIPITEEMDEQLVREGILPPRD